MRDSDDSESETEDVTNLPARADVPVDDSDDEEFLPPGRTVCPDDEVTPSSSSDEESALRPSGAANAYKNRRRAAATVTYKWRKKQLDVADIEKNINFPVQDEVATPLQYFKRLFDDNIIQMIIDQTNLYSVQQLGNSLNTNANEMSDFIPILLYTGLVKMPAYVDNWAERTRFPPIANTMSLKRFQKLRRYIHFSDNNEADGAPDRYFKVRPVMEMVRRNFLAIEHEGEFSVDEMMVPYKGTRAGNLRQYIRGKPHKWGFKLFTRAGVSGIV